MHQDCLDRLRNQSAQWRMQNRPVKINAPDFCDLVAESGTEDAGLLRAAHALANHHGPVYVEPMTLVTLVDSLEQVTVRMPLEALPPEAIPMPTLPDDWSPPGSPEC